ncbi:glucosamine-6-phosphate deaminase [Clostridium intestinale]|uniref:Glucosamine-6-phosphate deaminase n=1 Tax=Clostridium intestinale DSM 6191 TaxID=1121320 RepID=A0A1M6EV45_9CLOT|nr:glucosamine-6-phosphate deaminase [Clostridium intestinale]SHI89354.1 glucosamine-6-phosphate deaminase [Clostridium intestinale DSM 6191]
MKILVVKNYDEMSKVAAKELAEVISKKPEATLGLATGGTPVGMYKELIDMHKNGELDFSKVTTVNLDEYVGLSGEHDQSYRYFMDSNLFNHVNIRKEYTYVPNGLAEDMLKECVNYDKRIEELGGIDVQVLGIGSNGHIGFNEPSDTLSLGTHVTDLAESTIEANSRYFVSKEEVPTKALTMGLGAIMKAKKILLMVSGESKAEIMDKVVNGKITTQVPASFLQMHKDVVLIIDEDAARKIK